MEKHSQNQRERLNYLEFRVYFTGQISRSDLIQRFGISEAAATRDFAVYREEAPENIEFDTAVKIYRIATTFSPLFLKDIEPKQLLRALVHGIGDDFGTTPEVMVSCELPSRLQAPPAHILAAVSRAICQKLVLKIEYLSDSGNHGAREIVPISLVGTGLKWLVRAYCRRKNIFCDFVLNRIRNAEVIWTSKPLESETKDHDDEWNRMLKLELVPHPAGTPEKKAMTEQEFQMIAGVHILRVRAALAGYVLRLWSVDCSEEQRLKQLPLCLRNRIALHDVDNAILAPGYASQPPSN
jgi:predicted DNA-binding transcriptional regulator YafY